MTWAAWSVAVPAAASHEQPVVAMRASMSGTVIMLGW